ncbi:MAG: 30S ribosomal protein S20 [bacterium]
MGLRSKSGRKRVRSSIKRKARNLQAKGELKKALKSVEKALKQNASNVVELVKKATSIIDKVAQRGIIHKNKAARKKSRLMRKVKK